jgi:hypothetical protein
MSDILKKNQEGIGSLAPELTTSIAQQYESLESSILQQIFAPPRPLPSYHLPTPLAHLFDLPPHTPHPLPTILRAFNTYLHTHSHVHPNTRTITIEIPFMNALNIQHTVHTYSALLELLCRHFTK